MSNTRLRKRKALQYFLALSLLIVPVAYAETADRLDDLGGKLMCICGCNQVLIGCNHIDCKSSVPMIEELRTHINSGQSDAEVLASFVDKYTIKVLSSPPTRGFHWTAWITPFAVLAVGAFVAVFFVRKWKSESPASAPSVSSAANTEYQRRAEEELTKYTPED